MAKQSYLLSKTLVIGVIILFFNISFASSKNIIINDTTSKSIKNYNFHNKIYLNGDDEFTPENGVSGGNGTKGNPYIIENFIISGTGQYAIRILNTRAHFIIRNCTTNHCSNGIILLNVENGTIEGCQTSWNHYSGIYAEECKYINVINCTAFYNEGCGININGDYCFVAECCCGYNNDYYRFPYGSGIILRGSNNTLFDCISGEHVGSDIMVLNGVNNVINQVICEGLEIGNVHNSSVMNSESIVSGIGKFFPFSLGSKWRSETATGATGHNSWPPRCTGTGERRRREAKF